MSTPLQTELAKPEYAGSTEAQVVAALNAPIVTGRKPVRMADLKPLIYTDGPPPTVSKIKTAAAVAPDPANADAVALQAAAELAALWLFDPHIESLDLDNATAKAGLKLLVDGGVITQAIFDQINALGNIATTRAKQLGFSRPAMALDVRKARSAQ